MSLLKTACSWASRILKENRLFCGVWSGSLKPDMSLFLKPVATSLKQLYTDGK